MAERDHAQSASLALAGRERRRLKPYAVDETHAVEGLDALLRHRICATGISNVTFGYQRAQRQARRTLLLACTGGEGQVLIHGQFRRLRTGMFYLAPAGSPHAYRATQRTPWKLSFVEFAEIDGHLPLLSCAEPVVTVGDPRPLAHAVGALLREAQGPAEAVLLDRYAELVHLEAQRAIREFRSVERLRPAWLAVAADPGRSWNLSALAKEVGLSPEQLRVVCRRETGRTPMRQVAHLRMQRAATILATDDTKLDAVAEAVGYGSSFAFCAAFKREMGMTPGAYRAQRSAGPATDD